MQLGFGIRSVLMVRVADCGVPQMSHNCSNFIAPHRTSSYQVVDMPITTEATDDRNGRIRENHCQSRSLRTSAILFIIHVFTCTLITSSQKAPHELCAIIWTSTARKLALHCVLRACASTGNEVTTGSDMSPAFSGFWGSGACGTTAKG